MSRDMKCSHCERVFKWGADEDSALGVQAAGPTCGENAYWKLHGHMKAEHPDQFFVCPRQYEGGPFGAEPSAFWEGDGTCSYCGSLKPDTLLEAIEAGTVTLGATDKNYKLYVEGLPDPEAGQPTIYHSANYAVDGLVLLTKELADEHGLNSYDREKIGSYVKIEPRRSDRHDKFYFQHFDEEQRKRFVELYNANRMRFRDYRCGEHVEVARGFYRLPFFMAPVRPAEAAE